MTEIRTNRTHHTVNVQSSITSDLWSSENRLEVDELSDSVTMVLSVLFIVHLYICSLIHSMFISLCNGLSIK